MPAAARTYGHARTITLKLVSLVNAHHLVHTRNIKFLNFELRLKVKKVSILHYSVNQSPAIIFTHKRYEKQ